MTRRQMIFLEGFCDTMAYFAKSLPLFVAGMVVEFLILKYS